jgi:predicted ATPase
VALGHPDGALADAAGALSAAREIGHAATLTYALLFTWFTHVFCGHHSIGARQADEILVLAEEKDSALWRACGVILQGYGVALTGRASHAVKIITAGISALHATGLTLWMPIWLSCLAKTYAHLGQFDEAQRYIGEAITTIETSKETWCEAEVHRVAGEIALMPRRPNAQKAEAYFERALTAARHQQAKSWELRAAMSMARLWRGQGKRDEARYLLAPVYGWFTEGFDTLDLKEAKALLNELAS